jgi:hypothetical protein
MRRNSIACAIAFASVVSGSSFARAALLANDSFEYPTGSFAGANGGFGFSSPWTVGSAFTIAPGSLNAPAFQGVGNQVNFSSSINSFITMSRSLPTSFGSPGTDVWISYLTQPITLSAFSAMDFGLSFGHSLTVGILGGTSGAGPPSTTWGMDTVGGTGAVFSSVPVVYGQTTLLVVHATFQSGPDQIDLYINPGDTLPALPALSKTDLDLGFSQIGFGTNHGNVNYDELRIGTTFADVATVPEPSALLLVGFPMLAFVLRRKLTQ